MHKDERANGDHLWTVEGHAKVDMGVGTVSVLILMPQKQTFAYIQ